MPNHNVVSHDEWIAARIALLKKEKEFTRLRDDINRQRRALPWKPVDKEYEFHSSEGTVSLSELFGQASQLLIYHFMFGPDWKEGCKICSMIADHYEPLQVHLKARDVSMVTVSRAPIAAIDEFRQRMGWSFPWMSSDGSEFNTDFQASLQQSDIDNGTAYYNYQHGAKFPSTETPGMSVFFRDADGSIFHTYSVYARGLDIYLGVYNFLDVVPKGRDEAGLPYGMAWVRHHDRYEDEPAVDPYAPAEETPN